MDLLMQSSLLMKDDKFLKFPFGNTKNAYIFALSF
jgi:hypothetical protein